MKRFVAFLAGLLFVGIGIFLWISSESKISRCTVETVGTVIKTYEEGYGKNRQYYAELIYEAGEETITQVVSNISSKSSQGISSRVSIQSVSLLYEEGDTLEICYNPEDVDEFVIKGESRSKVAYILFIALGAMAVLGTIIKKGD